MWAYRLIAPGRFSRVDVPEPPEPRDGEVLLRTVAGGVCGSDLPLFAGLPGHTFPRPAGFPMHEIVGEVVESRHSRIRVGATVVGWAAEFTAIAEFVVTEGDQVHEFTATDDPVAAVVVQPLACVLYPLRRLDVRDRHVAVLGLGSIGLLFAREVAHAGARRVTGIDVVDRSDMADRFRVDEVVCDTTGNWSASLPEDDRPDVVIEAVGHQTDTLQHAVDACATGGHILYFGIPDEDVYPIDMESMVRKNLTLTAGATLDRPAMLARADARLATDLPAYRGLVTHVLPFDSVQQAFDRARSPRVGQAKIVIHG
jgi:threonine dehydrogenase-like Zn-dependent dehydrogenase